MKTYPLKPLKRYPQLDKVLLPYKLSSRTKSLRVYYNQKGKESKLLKTLREYTSYALEIPAEYNLTFSLILQNYKLNGRWFCGTYLLPSVMCNEYHIRKKTPNEKGKIKEQFEKEFSHVRLLTLEKWTKAVNAINKLIEKERDNDK